MKPLRPSGTLATLPTVTFGQRSMMYWGTLGFMTIEGWTTALLLAAYIYLRQNYQAWPPLRTPVPSLLIPTINLALMGVSLLPTILTQRAARRLDERAVKVGLVGMAIVEIGIIILRWWELWALNTRWDTTAYGSAAWTIVGFHTSLLLLDMVEAGGLTIFFFLKKLPVKAFSDTCDNCIYWYFTVALWVVIYLVVYVGPRFF